MSEERARTPSVWCAKIAKIDAILVRIADAVNMQLIASLEFLGWLNPDSQFEHVMRAKEGRRWLRSQPGHVIETTRHTLYLCIRKISFGSLPQQGARPSSMPGPVRFRAICAARPSIDDPGCWQSPRKLSGEEIIENHRK